MRQDVQDAITRAAREHGVDPAFALAIAQRESNFNPNARASKTIAGIYQMRGDLRHQYGVGDSADPYQQASGWMRFLPDVKRDMGSVLGRDPSDPESYLGHHFGARRAARMLKMDPATPVNSVFTAEEMSLNPHFARAGTVGNLNGSVMGDVGKRMARFGGPSTSGDAPTEPADLSSFGELVGDSGAPAAAATKANGTPESTADSRTAAAGLPDLSMYGERVETPAPTAAPQQPQDLSQYGTPV